MKIFYNGSNFRNTGTDVSEVNLHISIKNKTIISKYSTKFRIAITEVINRLFLQVISGSKNEILFESSASKENFIGPCFEFMQLKKIS